MNALMTLPPEIRAIIINHILLLPLPSPLTTSAVSNPPLCSRTPGPPLPPDPRWRKNGNFTYHDTTPITYHSSLLRLLLNKQLYAEAFALSRILPSIAKLTITISHANLLFVSWTCNCTPSTSPRRKHYDFLEATLQIEGPLHSRFGTSSMNFGDGGPPPMTIAFLKLLEGFLRIGVRVPNGDVKVEDEEDQGFTIGMLSINVKSPVFVHNEWEAMDLRSAKEWWGQPPRNKKWPVQLDARNVASWFRSYLRMILNPGSKYMRYAEEIFKCVGKLGISVNGEEFCEWDVAMVLALGKWEAQRESSANQEVDTARVDLEWLEVCENERRRKGLVVLENFEWQGDEKQRWTIVNGEVGGV